MASELRGNRENLFAAVAHRRPLQISAGKLRRSRRKCGKYWDWRAGQKCKRISSMPVFALSGLTLFSARVGAKNAPYRFFACPWRKSIGKVAILLFFIIMNWTFASSFLWRFLYQRGREQEIDNIWRLGKNTQRRSWKDGEMRKHCQRHNGPEGWVLLIKLTSFGHMTSFYTNLDQTSSESWPSTNFKISTKHQHLDKT